MGHEGARLRDGEMEKLKNSGIGNSVHTVEGWITQCSTQLRPGDLLFSFRCLCALSYRDCLFVFPRTL